MKSIIRRFGVGAIAASLTLGIGPVGEQTIAANGFSPGQDFPRRDTTYDGYLATSAGTISDEQMAKLWNHIAFPQSHGALTNLLGHPVAYSGSYEYYRYNGSEVAVYYDGGTAFYFTVGY